MLYLSTPTDVASIRERFSPEHLEERVGGDYKFEFDHATYWPQAVAIPTSPA